MAKTFGPHRFLCSDLMFFDRLGYHHRREGAVRRRWNLVMTSLGMRFLWSLEPLLGFLQFERMEVMHWSSITYSPIGEP